MFEIGDHTETVNQHNYVAKKTSRTNSYVNQNRAKLSDSSPIQKFASETDVLLKNKPEVSCLQNQHVSDDVIRIDQMRLANHSRSVDPELIATIVGQWRQRRAWHRAEKSLTLQAKAMCRGLAICGDKKEAEVIYAAALGKGEHIKSELAFAAMFPLIEARDSLEKRRKDIEKRLFKLAEQLHVAQFVRDTRGVGLASLAAIIGETGDLSNYSTVAKLWKRMGVAVMPDGTRQRRVKDAIEAELHGYNPERRSVLWNIGACVMKAGGPLKELYDARKIIELAKCEEISKTINTKYSAKAHAHNRAQRYVEKRFLKLLWSEWRRQTKVDMSI